MILVRTCPSYFTSVVQDCGLDTLSLKSFSRLWLVPLIAIIAIVKLSLLEMTKTSSSKYLRTDLLSIVKMDIFPDILSVPIADMLFIVW